MLSSVKELRIPCGTSSRKNLMQMSWSLFDSITSMFSETCFCPGNLTWFSFMKVIRRLRKCIDRILCTLVETRKTWCKILNTSLINWFTSSTGMALMIDILIVLTYMYHRSKSFHVHWFPKMLLITVGKTTQGNIENNRRTWVIKPGKL